MPFSWSSLFVVFEDFFHIFNKQQERVGIASLAISDLKLICDILLNSEPITEHGSLIAKSGINSNPHLFKFYS